MDDKERRRLREEIILELDERQQVTDEELYSIIDRRILEYGQGSFLPLKDKKELRGRLFDSFRRLGSLQELVDDEDVTEIMVNGADMVFVERNGRMEQWGRAFESQEQLEDTIQQIVSRVNRTVNVSRPIADARLSDGSRVNIVLPPVALEGPVVTIRKFPDNPITIHKLIETGSITEEVSGFLEKLVIAGYNIFISGGTGSGKTTFLNVLSNFIPKDERVITIEDSAELQIKSIPNLVKLEARNANVEGKNAVTIRELIKSSLRMRPDRIVVGEVRDDAAIDMLQAMNTGHDGSMSTGHANSTVDMLNRLETLVLMGTDIPLMAVRKQIASAIDIIVHLGRLRDKSRKVLEVSEVLDCTDGEIEVNKLYVFKESGEGSSGKVLGELQKTNNELINLSKLSKAGIL